MDAFIFVLQVIGLGALLVIAWFVGVYHGFKIWGRSSAFPIHFVNDAQKTLTVTHAKDGKEVKTHLLPNSRLYIEVFSHCSVRVCEFDVENVENVENG